MRFLGDMGISPKVIRKLNDQGYDAVHLNDEGLGRLSDIQILEKARVEQRIILTHDLDFGYLLSLSGDLTPGVILFRLTDMSAGSVSSHLSSIIPSLSSLETQQFIVVTDSGARIRQLPIKSKKAVTDT